MIAEPWDIGPGGYQLGNFGPPWLEWNDHARDDIRRFWRGDPGTKGAHCDTVCQVRRTSLHANGARRKPEASTSLRPMTAFRSAIW
jgi:pullulanase/glycogen debranching enzyme